MKLEFVEGKLEELSGPCLLTFINESGDTIPSHPLLQERLKPHHEAGELGKSLGGSLYLIDPQGFAFSRVLVMNLGKESDRVDELRRAAALGWKALRKKGNEALTVSVAGMASKERRAVIEGLTLGAYQFTELKTDKDALANELEQVLVHGCEDGTAELERALAICQGTNRARDLCQLPANILNPVTIAEKAAAWGESFGYSTEILKKEAIEDLAMGAMLSVSQGSVIPPRFIIMDYQPANPSGKTIALVGKAVTFDSGGLSLKPANSMPEMKGDMGGGAAVIGAMTVLRDMGCTHRVIGLVPAVENMPSGSATRPSDVVTSLSGQTVEVNNTDAEGRLILADALTYAARYKPDFVVDYATLTGACLVALGPKICGVMGNDQALVDAVIDAGNEVAEPFWQLPLYEPYNELLKSSVADFSNVSSVRWGGTITAGLFLQKFAKDYRWAHCDIAAAIFDRGDDYYPDGGTGIGVRMTADLLTRIPD